MKKITTYNIASITLLLISNSIFAQTADTLIAGTVLKRANTVKPESHQYSLFFEMPDGKIRFVGLETRIAEEVNYKGKRVGCFIQKYQSDKGVSYDTTFFEPGTLLG